MPAPAAARSNESEWLLEQDQTELGKIAVYVSHDAIKIVSRGWGYQMVCKAPTWTVHCFRPEQKVEAITELEDFSGSMVTSPVAKCSKSTDHLNAYSTGEVNGLRYTKYAQSKYSRSVIYGADDIPIAAKASEFLSRLYILADVGKVPLYRCKDKGLGVKPKVEPKNLWLAVDSGEDLRTGLVVQLTTKSGKKQPFNASDFEYPHGYKRQSLTQVAYSDRQKEMLNDALDNMGFVSDHPHEKLKQPSPATEPKVR